MMTTTNDAPLAAPLTSVTSSTDALQAPYRISLAEELAVINRQQLKMRVVDALAAGERQIVLDARECGYIDTSGLGVLVSINKKCREAGGSLVIEGLSPELREYFSVIHLDTVLTLTDAPADPAAR